MIIVRFLAHKSKSQITTDAARARRQRLAFINPNDLQTPLYRRVARYGWLVRVDKLFGGDSWIISKVLPRQTHIVCTTNNSYSVDITHKSHPIQAHNSHVALR